MKLEFDLKISYGKKRFYPISPKAEAVVALTERKCLREDEIEALNAVGFGLLITRDGQTILDVEEY